LLSDFDFELVTYDEEEVFRPVGHEQFDYPFQQRKSKVTGFQLRIDDESNLGDYSYQ
jgi:hypothetical protein